MAKRSFSNAGTAWAAVADTTALTANQFMTVNGGAATQLVNIMEVYLGGQATALAVSPFLLARDSTAGAGTITIASPFADGPLLNTATAVASPVLVAHTFGTTQPQRAATVTLARLNFTMNCFGGIVKWTAAPGEEWQILGAGANIETSLSVSSANAGAAGSAGAHIIYEPF